MTESANGKKCTFTLILHDCSILIAQELRRLFEMQWKTFP